ncbi:MAG: hypothetical protein IVW57_02090 [Ktedonobacterales bacterium]|nr:hypothetical protein [Ktedonobacterales bacterium]
MTAPSVRHAGMRRIPVPVGSLVGVEVASVVAGLAAAYLSLAFLSAIGFKASGSDLRDLYLGVVGACVLVGLLDRRVLADASRPLSVGGGALFGVLCSALAHPLMWFFALLINALTADPTVFIGLEWQRQFPIPFVVMYGAIFFPFYSLIYVGWITGLVGGCVGALLAWLAGRWRARAYGNPDPIVYSS